MVYHGGGKNSGMPKDARLVGGLRYELTALKGVAKNNSCTVN
jgi:hypothetical protein